MKLPRPRLSALSGAQVLLLTAAAAGITSALSFSVPAMSAQLEQARTLADQAAQTEQQVDDAARLRNDPRARRTAAALRSAIPSEPTLDAVLVDLRDLASNSGVTWRSATTTTAPPTSALIGGHVREIGGFTMAVTLEADPSQLSRFVAALPKLPRLVTVDALTVDGATAVVSLRVFTLPERK